MPAVAADRLGELQERANHYDVIGIDEGQFFPDVVYWCEEMVTALDRTFSSKRPTLSNAAT